MKGFINKSLLFSMVSLVVSAPLCATPDIEALAKELSFGQLFSLGFKKIGQGCTEYKNKVTSSIDSSKKYVSAQGKKAKNGVSSCTEKAVNKVCSGTRAVVNVAKDAFESNQLICGIGLGIATMKLFEAKPLVTTAASVCALASYVFYKAWNTELFGKKLVKKHAPTAKLPVLVKKANLPIVKKEAVAHETKPPVVEGKPASAHAVVDNKPVVETKVVEPMTIAQAPKTLKTGSNVAAMRELLKGQIFAQPVVNA